MRKILAAALLFSVVSAPACAEGSVAYLFGELGSTNYQNAGLAPNPGNFGFGAGFRVDENIVLEFGYTGFGNSSITYLNTGETRTLKARSFHPAIVATLPLNSQLSALGKFGLALNKAEASSNQLGVLATSSQNSFYFALGIQYNLNDQFGMRVQYEDFGKFESATNPLTASAVTFAAVFNL